MIHEAKAKGFRYAVVCHMAEPDVSFARCVSQYLIETQLAIGSKPHEDHPTRKYHKKHYKVYRPQRGPAIQVNTPSLRTPESLVCWQPLPQKSKRRAMKAGQRPPSSAGVERRELSEDVFAIIDNLDRQTGDLEKLTELVRNCTRGSLDRCDPRYDGMTALHMAAKVLCMCVCMVVLWGEGCDHLSVCRVGTPTCASCCSGSVPRPMLSSRTAAPPCTSHATQEACARSRAPA